MKSTRDNRNPLAMPKGGKDRRRAVAKLGKGKKEKKSPETEAHAKEIREVAKGRDIVEHQRVAQERRPAAFDRRELMVVRAWLKNRPLEPLPSATALIPFPRMWNTKRGRYARFQAPGSGAYGLLRARPSF